MQLQNQNPFERFNSIISEIQNNLNYTKEHDPLEVERLINDLSNSILTDLHDDPKHVNLEDAYTFQINASKLLTSQNKNYANLDKSISKISADILNSKILNVKLEIIEKIPQEYREKFLKLITLMAKDEEISPFKIENLADEVPLELIESLIELKSAHPSIKTSSIEDIVKVIQSFPEAGRTPFINLAKILNHPYQSGGSQIATLSEILVDLPVEQITNFSNFFIKVKSKNGIDLKLIEKFTEAVLKFPEEQLGPFFEFVDKIQFPKRIFPDEALRKSLISITELFLIIPDWLRIFEFNLILKFQKEIPVKDLKNVLLNFVRIKDPSTGIDLNDLKGLSEEYKTMLNNTIERAISFFTDQMNANDRVAILQNLEFAQVLVDCGIDLSKKSQLSSLSNLMKKNVDISEVINISKNFITKDMNLLDIRDTFNIIADLPDASRQPMIECIKHISDESMLWNDRAAIIQILLKLDPLDRDRVVKQFKSQTTTSLNWTQKIALLLCLAKLGEDSELIEKIKQTPKKEAEELILEGEFELPFIDMRADSNFADTDLVILRDDFKGGMSLNGVKEREFHQIEELFNKIKANQTPIKIIRNDEHFPHQIEKALKLLLTRSIGRDLIYQILNHSTSQGLELPIFEGNETAYLPGYGISVNLESTSTSAKFEHLPSGNIQARAKGEPLQIDLGHEMIHVLHDLKEGFEEALKITAPLLHQEYDNLEEQRTITGFNKEETLPQELFSDSTHRKRGEMPHKSEFVEWDEELEEPLKEPWDFDRLNERNLTAAFTTSNQGFYPRFGHKSNPIQALEGMAAVKADLEKRFQKLPLSQDEIQSLLNL